MRILLPATLLLLAFWVYSILYCAFQPADRHRGVSKPVWLVIIVLLPVVGGILWFIVGRGAARPPQDFRAPDDDLAFLGSIGSISDQDERIRRLEAELAALDAEDEPDASRASGARPTPDTDEDGDAPSRGPRGSSS